MLLERVAVTYQVPCDQCPLRSCEIFRPLTEDELGRISVFKSGELRVGVGATVLSEGIRSDLLFTLLEGWAFRYKTMEDGRRQITNFVLPGDFIGLQGSMHAEMDHSVECLTAAVFCTFPRDRLFDFFASTPSLGFDITWLASREERVLDENLLSVGRRTATERAAYYLLYLYQRAEELGLSNEGQVRFPFTQQHLADSLGLSLVHTNKVLRRLAQRGLIEWQHGWFRAPHREALAELAGFDLNRNRTRPLI
jgi:CRP-like cAMP-binding protein